MSRTSFEFVYGHTLVQEGPAPTDSFLRRCRSHVEFVVDPRELDSRSEGFLQKITEALIEGPQAIVVNLLSASQITSACIGVLLRARANVVREGISFAVRPTCPVTRDLLCELGLAKILGVPA